LFFDDLKLGIRFSAAGGAALNNQLIKMKRSSIRIYCLNIVAKLNSSRNFHKWRSLIGICDTFGNFNVGRSGGLDNSRVSCL